ncbi:MAG: hypothetical protein EA376_10300 [Phycisphaeraceae bacterium]|nr:MAG: hypothetical protein EA376_10300 [Phycisphaeraceae bacterium]
MDQLRQVLATIQTQLSRLTSSQKLLIASAMIIMVMTLFVVAQYAGGRSMVELFPAASPPEQQQRAIEFLQASNIEHSVRDGRALVPVDRKYFILGQMGQQGALPDDTALLFSNLVENTSWTMSSQQTRQLSNIALQNELSRVITHFEGMRSATVFIDAPEPTGLGRAARTPTATVTVFPSAGRAINQDTVDAIASMVAGARSGLDPSAVRVIDGVSRRQHRARSEEDFVTSSYMEHAAKVEDRVRLKLLDVLQYIEGVVVAVNAQVDVTRRVQERTSVLAPGAGSVTTPLREFTRESERSGGGAGAEAGARPNTGMDIARGGGGGITDRQTESEAELETRYGSESERIIDPRGMPTRISATVTAPRSYFVRVWRLISGAADDVEPTEDDLAPIVEAERLRIEQSILPIVETGVDAAVAGAVVVSIAPDFIQAPIQAGFGSGGFFGPTASGGTGILATGWIKTLGLSALAALSLGMMALALRKATRPQELPTPEELVGVPPSLSARDPDMVGEADEAEAALAGVEMSDDEIQLRKKVEQVAKLVKEKPAEAASLLDRWISSDE